MRTLRYVPLLALLGLLLVAPRLCARDDPWDFEVEVPYTDAEDPFTADRLRARLERMAVRVGDVVGEPIRVDALGFRTSNGFVAAERDLAASYPRLVDPSHEDYATTPMILAHGGLLTVWNSLLGRYDSGSKTIEIYPFAFEVLEPDDLGALLDVVLAHELVHVWQDQRFGVFDHEGVEGTEEAELARAAALEGSAEFVAREVARKLGIVEAFDLVAAERNERDGEATGQSLQRAHARWLRWAYGAGLRFVEAVHEELGPAGTWERLFRDLPTTVWAVEHPRAWVDRRAAQDRDLDAWVGRLVWCLETVPPLFAFQETWGHRPILREDIEDRLANAQLQPGSGPWADCRGGVLVVGTPERGALADEEVLLQVWRFPTPGHALAARRTLETAFDAIGPRAWAGADAGEAVGPPRVREGRGGALARTSLVLDETPLYAHEGTWAVRTHDALLLEGTCWRTGAAPALLELLDTAVGAWTAADPIDAARQGAGGPGNPWAALAALRAAPPGEADGDADAWAAMLQGPPPLRDEALAHRLARPKGEDEILRRLLEHPRDAGAWTAALGPAAGHEEEEWDRERGPLLIAALKHDDDDVQRFALGTLADGRSIPTPWSGELVSRVADATHHEDAAVRSVALRAAEALKNEKILDGRDLDRLAADPSSAVRATLTASREVLGERELEVLGALAGDPHPAVRRAAQAKTVDTKSPLERALERLVDSLTNDGDAAEAEDAEKTAVDRAAAYALLFEAMFQGGPDEDRSDLADRLQGFLDEGDDEVRMIALRAVQHMGSERARFLPEMVRAFEAPGSRWAAMSTLCEGGLDLTPAREHLLRMLEHPRWRADVLRVLAANEVELPDGVRRRTRAWMESTDPLLRCAAALLLLRLDPEDPEPLEVLDATWELVSEEVRTQVLRAASTVQPRAAITARMRARALASPYSSERRAVLESAADGVYDEAYLEALLGGVQRLGPVVAGDSWSAFLRAVIELEEEDERRAGDLLARFLQRWCDADRLPGLCGDEVVSWDSMGLGGSRALVEAIDRCLVRDDGAALRLALALIRHGMDADLFPESPEVKAALDHVYSLEDAPERLPPYERDGLTSTLAERPDLAARTVQAALRRDASRPWDGYGIDVEDLLAGHPDRVTAALDLAPGFLDRGTRRSVCTALSILEAAGASAADMLPRLRDLSERSLPTWRDRITACIAGIEGAAAREKAGDSGDDGDE